MPIEKFYTLNDALEILRLNDVRYEVTYNSTGTFRRIHIYHSIQGRVLWMKESCCNGKVTGDGFFACNSFRDKLIDF